MAGASVYPLRTDLPCYLFFSKKWATGLAKKHGLQCLQSANPTHCLSPLNQLISWHVGLLPQINVRLVFGRGLSFHLGIQARLRNEKEMREIERNGGANTSPPRFSVLPNTIMSESYSDLVLQTPVLMAETQTGTQAAPKYVDSNCCHK